MTASEILSNAYVIVSSQRRLEQFRRTLSAAGMDGSLPHEWDWCPIENEGTMGDAVAQYSLVRHALAINLPFLVVFEDDAVPSDDAAQKMVAAFEGRKDDTLCLSLGWSYDSDPDKGRNRGDKRRVYGSHAYALFGEKAYRAYLSAWEKNGYPDIVLGLVEGSKMTQDNLFAQHTPAGFEGIHLPAGWTADAELEKIVDKELVDRFSKARAEIDRIRRERDMHVAYTIDVQGQGAAQFVDQIFVSAYSLRQSMAKGDSICCHILYGNITADLMRKMNALSTEQFRIEFTPIKAQDMAYMQSISNKKNNPLSNVRTWSGIVFARLWIPLALPKVDRCIYLDNDTFVRKSLRPLWDTDMGDELLGMAMGTVPEYGYNSGVMLFDCKTIRSENASHGLYARLSEHLEQFAHTYFCPDQTTINRYFAGRIKELGMEWNFPPRPGYNDRKALAEAAIWHFYEGGKPVRLGTDEFGASCLEWNEWLKRAEREVSP